MTYVRVLRTLAVYLRPYRAQVVLLVLGLLVDVAFQAVMPVSFKYLIDDAIPQHDRRLLWIILGIMIGAVLVASAAAIGRDYLYAKLGTRVMNDLRLRMFEHLQRLSADYFGRARTGDVLARFSTDIAAMNNAVVSALPETILGTIGIAFYTVVLFTLEPQLALVALIGFPTLLIGPRLLGRPAQAESVRVLDTEGAIAGSVQESFGSQSAIRAFGLNELQIRSFRRQLAELSRRNLRFNLLSYLVERTPNVAFLLLQVGILAAGAAKAFAGDLQIGTLVAFNSILLSLSVAITGLTRILPSLLAASGGADRITELLNESPTVLDPSSPEALPPIADRVTFADVGFSYDGERKQLDGVSFEIRRGMKVAFVGPSGSGKSTVLSLLLRFFDPQSGVVAIDGRDIRTVTQASLRQQMGVVLQESFLFDMTVRENIRLGRLDATDEEVEAAAAAAEVDAFIGKLPEGYDTPVGERGGRLSGGQRQRVAIARAVVRQPAILVLDEATSALDPGTEASVSATIDRLATDRTVVAVTHRLSTVLEYDRIFVLQDGRLVEQGTHAELVALGGVYAQLWSKQSGVAVSSDGRSARVSGGFLRVVPVLAGLSEEGYERLARLFGTEHAAEGQTVVSEGDPIAEKFYIVARGRVAVTSAGGPLAVLSDGDYFGEISLLRDIPRTATVSTLTPCVFLTLRRAQFLDFLSSEPRVEQEMVRLIEQRSDELEAAHRRAEP